jgi:hypothetical protein
MKGKALREMSFVSARWTKLDRSQAKFGFALLFQASIRET